MTEAAPSSIDNRAELADSAGPQRTENGFGAYEWDPERGVVFRMDLDQFGTIGGVPGSQYIPPPRPRTHRSTSPESIAHSGAAPPSSHPTGAGVHCFSQQPGARLARTGHAIGSSDS